ncbi:hypothetical protein ACJMK2_037811 [Sinanodonta woodiana]|uniref:CNH domain-containing protein n=1 Tax=Sinanodonta woodiana TaxID=1069815 RepID=A0ABD3WLL6_SINWO
MMTYYLWEPKKGTCYSIKSRNLEQACDTKYEVSLERSNKSFSKKPISQLAVIPEVFLLISLSDYVVSVHDLSTFGQIVSLAKTKGATLFEVDLQKPASLSGEVQPYLRMCVAVKRKIQLMYWKNRDFHELQTDLNLYDIPRAMAWCKDSLCVGFKRDYFLIKVNTGESKELFPTGSNQLEPVVTKLDDNMLLLSRDKMSIFIDADGNPVKNQPLTWSDIPFDTVHDPPYLIAVLPKYIEIRTMEPPLLIQSSEHKARYICKGSGYIYIASSNHIWQLNSVPVTIQIKQLLQGKEFELALRLADMTDEPELEKHTRINHIKTLYAFHLFCQHRFQESMQIFVKLETDPSNVIGMYPNLLPPEFRNQLEYPEKLPELEGGDLEKALLALIDYLTEKRRILSKDKEVLTTAIKEGNKTVKSKDQLGQIIDTTLLKCYLETNDALVAPLLRLKDNKCHIEESERSLKKKEKFSELIILYEKKGLHDKALQLLMKQAARPNSPLGGYEKTVQYLQHLGADHLNLIFEYAKWVLKESAEDGLKIFTEDLPEVESLPRDKILQYLEKISKDLAIPYLEHIINNCHDQTEEFHNCLGHLLREKVQNLMQDYLKSHPEGPPQVKPGREPGELGRYRIQLITFLNCSMFYKPEKLLTRFPMDGFFEERAILLGRLGRHEQALGIYVHVLKDKRLAEEYCMNYYDKSLEGNKDVYAHLLKMYLQPPEPSSLGLSSYSDSKPRTDMEAALGLLEDHAGKIDTAKALDLLPPTTKVKEILTYLENVLELKYATKHHCQILKSMLHAESLQVHEQRMFYEKIKVVITDEKICRVCKKRIGGSFFARYPNGIIVHYGCCKDPKEAPFDS